MFFCVVALLDLNLVLAPGQEQGLHPHQRIAAGSVSLA
jgi:hypothetical protein